MGCVFLNKLLGKIWVVFSAHPYLDIHEVSVLKNAVNLMLFKNPVYTLQRIPLHLLCDREAPNGVWRSGNRFTLAGLC
jgi:hypothetical protein